MENWPRDCNCQYVLVMPSLLYLSVHDPLNFNFRTIFNFFVTCTKWKLYYSKIYFIFCGSQIHLKLKIHVYPKRYIWTQGIVLSCRYKNIDNGRFLSITRRVYVGHYMLIMYIMLNKYIFGSKRALYFFSFKLNNHSYNFYL